MNYFELHIGDYDSATAHLSPLEDGIYNRLLRVYYRTEQPIPAELKQACRLVRAVSKAERDTVQVVLGEFFELRQDGWHNVRCDEEIARFKDKQAKARRSAEARWGAHETHSEGTATAVRTHSEGNAPRARPQTPITNLFSEPNGSDGEPSQPKSASEKSKSELWSAAVSLLGAQGMAEPQARSFFGKLSKDYPEGDIVLDAVRGAVSEQPADARAYLKATCQRLAGERHGRNRKGQAEDWTATAT